MNRLSAELAVARPAVTDTDMAGGDAGGFVLLCRRRTGGGALMRLLASLATTNVLPDQPFLWHGPLGGISRGFYQGDRMAALAELDAAMGRPQCFLHIYEFDAHIFNEALLDALAAHSRRVVLFDRADEVARAFSRIVTGHFGLGTREAVAEFRRNLDPDAPLPPEIYANLEEQVLWDIECERRMSAELQRRDMAVCASSMEQVFNCGIDGLAEFDRIARFAGLGTGRARLGERALLDRLLHGAHYTEALAGRSAAFAELRARIEAIVARA